MKQVDHILRQAQLCSIFVAILVCALFYFMVDITVASSFALGVVIGLANFYCLWKGLGLLSRQGRFPQESWESNDSEPGRSCRGGGGSNGSADGGGAQLPLNKGWGFLALKVVLLLGAFGLAYSYKHINAIAMTFGLLEPLLINPLYALTQAKQFFKG